MSKYYGTKAAQHTVQAREDDRLFTMVLVIGAVSLLVLVAVL